MTKTEIKQICIERLNNQIVDLKNMMIDVQSASNQETKSTAGDKHDTARAQTQIEVERLGNQLLILENMLQDLRKISTEPSKNITLGSFVFTTFGNFYLSVSLGKISENNIDFFAISKQAPLGKILLGKSVNDSVNMPHGNSFKIVEII